ncbi:MAG: YvrJ family protein [Clostridium sp.]|uniref:YvrJ family protein n=1 Tax=Clostridium sp. TaxID=1506 RepID=UPI003EE5200C
MEGLVELIGNVGFPIGVSFYLLIRIEAKIEVLTASINNLSNVVSKLESDK